MLSAPSTQPRIHENLVSRLSVERGIWFHGLLHLSPDCGEVTDRARLLETHGSFGWWRECRRTTCEWQDSAVPFRHFGECEFRLDAFETHCFHRKVPGNSSSLFKRWWVIGGPFLIHLSLWGAPGSNAPRFTIPPELAYERVVLSKEKNAVVEWQQAVALYVVPEGLAKETLASPWIRNARPLTDGERRDFTQWLARNRQAMELIEIGRRKGRLQWTQHRPEDSEPALTVLKSLLQARLVQVVRLKDRQDEDVAEHVLSTLQMADLIADGEGPLIHYLVGQAVKSLCWQAIQKIALESSTSAGTLNKLWRGIPSSEDEVEVYARAVRVEFSDYVLVESSPTQLAEQWQAMMVKNPEILDLTVPEELQRAFRIFLTPSLVAQHPRPLDHAKQVVTAIPNFQRHLANARGSWKDRRPEPDQTEILNRFLKDATPVLAKVEKEKLPLSKKAIERIRPAYNQIDNPLGRLFDSMSSPLGPSFSRVFRGRAEREATRVLLALQLFHRRERRWPASLGELVSRGLLEAVPRDPFGEDEFRYSQARGLIWSVGSNGRDDDGKSGSGSRWDAPDAVWSFIATQSE